MSLYPDYGTPGAPSMDPYYVSPTQLAEQEAHDADLREAAEDDLRTGLDDLVKDARTVLEAQKVATALQDAADRMWRAVR